MDKDELKNRISLALTDPILQQGFEIICKENAELKEINAMVIAEVKIDLFLWAFLILRIAKNMQSISPKQRK